MTDIKKMTDIEKDFVVPPNENFRGRSYGDWAATWTNWLFSQDPDSTDQGEGHMFFLRGNIGYYAYAAKERNLEALDEAKSFYNKTGDQSVLISEGTAIFIPILEAFYFIGGPFEGGKLDNEEQVRYAARKENDKSGGIWAIIQRADRDKSSNRPIVSDLKLYRAESPLFKLTISDRNPFLKYYALEYPMDPGKYDAVVDGYFLILRNLAPGSYRIQFGGKGRGNYRTDAVYDIHITRRPQGLLEDISGGNKRSMVHYENSSPNVPTHTLPSLEKLSDMAS